MMMLPGNYPSDMPSRSLNGEFYQHTASLAQSNHCHNQYNCPYQSCDANSSVARIQVGALVSSDQLFEPLNNRTSMVEDANKRHDPFELLPTELISEIFEIYCLEELLLYGNIPPLVIGSVCRRWRDITLGTPQLWSIVCIFPDPNQPYDLDVAAEWLRRSGSLPLTLHIGFDPDLELPEDGDAFSPLIDLLRSHSTRWKELSVSDASLSSPFLHSLLNNLEIIPSNFLALKVTGTSDFGHEYNMDCLLSPETLWAFSDSSTIGLPVQWNRLTSIDVRDALYLDEIIQIIKEAPLLTTCVLLPQFDFRDLDIWAERTFDLPDVPITNKSITSLKVESSEDAAENILKYLTLPSLHVLSYKHYFYSDTDDPDLHVLQDFLDRSSPSLREFHFTANVSWHRDYNHNQWLGKKFPITSLSVDLLDFGTGGGQEESAKDFLHLLSKTLDNDGLPSLRRLEFALLATPRFWSALCNFLQQRASIPERVGRESIKSVAINLHPSPTSVTSSVSMDPSVFSSLVDIETSGLKITVCLDPSLEYRLSAIPKVFLDFITN